jgi:hypothetical protein
VSVLADDCDDTNPTVYPGAVDPPGDGIDQNCDALQDCYRDLDGDGWGSSTIIPSANGACIGAGISPKTGDCDDASNAIYPTAVEGPNNGVDQDCDGFEDEDFNVLTDPLNCGTCGNRCPAGRICRMGRCQ